MGTATACKHCHTAPVVKTIDTKVPGAKPIALGLCNCDYLDCRMCGGKVRNFDAKSQVCSNCR